MFEPFPIHLKLVLQQLASVDFLFDQRLRLNQALTRSSFSYLVAFFDLFAEIDLSSLRMYRHFLLREKDQLGSLQHSAKRV
tara:strand:- start:380 stop:622 length:243 start_codon:yes stop_codon:yes gene_type:complete